MGFGGGYELLYGFTEPSVSKPVPYAFLCLIVFRVGGYLEEVFVQTSYVLVNGDVVVIQNDQYVRLAGSGVVQSFECETACERSVSDEGDSLMRKTLQFGCFGKT